MRKTHLSWLLINSLRMISSWEKIWVHQPHLLPSNLQHFLTSLPPPTKTSPTTELSNSLKMYFHLLHNFQHFKNSIKYIFRNLLFNWFFLIQDHHRSYLSIATVTRRIYIRWPARSKWLQNSLNPCKQYL